VLALTAEHKNDLKGKLTSGAYKVAFNNLLARPSSAASIPSLASSANPSVREPELTPQGGEAV